jgi:hypothetical protein
MQFQQVAAVVMNLRQKKSGASSTLSSLKGLSIVPDFGLLVS